MKIIRLPVLIALACFIINTASAATVKSVVLDDGRCALQFSPTRSAGQPLRLVVSTDRTDIRLSVEDAVETELVTADQRRPFNRNTFPDSAQFARSPIGRQLFRVARFHLTAATGKQTYRTARFDSINLASILSGLSKACKLHIEPFDAPAAEAKLQIDLPLLRNLHLAIMGPDVPLPDTMRLTSTFRAGIMRTTTDLGVTRSRYLSTAFIDRLLATAGLVLPPRYDALEQPSGETVPASQYGRWGLLGLDGRWRIRPRFDRIFGGGGDRFAASLGARIFVVESPGGSAEVGSVGVLRDCAEGVCRIETATGWKLLSLLSASASRQDFEALLPRRSGLTALRAAGQWYLLNQDGSTLALSKDVRRVRHVNYGIASFEHTNGGMGLMDGSGRVIIAPRRGMVVARPGDGMTAAGQRQWGYVDNRTGRTLISGAIKTPRPFGKSSAVIQGDDDRWYLIDRKGRRILGPARRPIVPVSSEHAAIVDDDGSRLIHLKSRDTLDMPFDRYETAAEDTYTRFRLDGRWGMIDIPRFMKWAKKRRW